MVDLKPTKKLGELPKYSGMAIELQDQLFCQKTSCGMWHTQQRRAFAGSVGHENREIKINTRWRMRMPQIPR
jgi:hypothetical protein